MLEVFLTILAMFSVVVLLRGMRDVRHFYELPFLVAAIVAVFVLPQLLTLYLQRTLPINALLKTTAMTGLCALASTVGFVSTKSPLRMLNWEPTQSRLKCLVLFFLAISVFCVFALRSLPEARISGNLSGLPVVYLFFFKFNSYALAISAFEYAKRRSKWALMASLVSVAIYFDRIVIAGKRAEAAEVCLAIALGLWFARGRAIRRPVIVALLLSAFFVVNGIGTYRREVFQHAGYGMALEIDKELLQRISTAASKLFSAETFELITKRQPAWELRNAAYTIHSCDIAHTLNLGASHWNAFVFTYVPAQVVGADVKMSLFLNLEDDIAGRVCGYRSPPGTTITGMANSYASFGYLGCIEFFLIGVYMKKLYLAALRGHYMARILYMLLLAPSIQAFTHHTDWAFLPWVHIGIFLLPGMWLCRSKAALPAGHAVGTRRSRGPVAIYG